MAGISPIIVKIAADTTGINAALNKTQRELSLFGGTVGKLGAGLLAAFSFDAIVRGMTDMALAAAEDQKSLIALQTTMQNLGMGAANSDTEEFIRKLSLSAAVADDELRPALGRLLNATGDLAQSQALLQTALDLSAAGYGSAESAATALSKAANGNIGALKKLGIPLSEAAVKGKDFALAVEEINAKVGGQSAAAADTYAGQMKKIGIAADEAKETIGYALLDALENVGEALGGTGGVVEMMTEAGDATANFVTGVSQAVQPVMDLVGALNQLSGTSSDGGFIDGLLELGADWGGPFAAVAMGYQQIINLGAEYNAEQKKINDSLRASEALYAGYTATLDATSTAAEAATEAQMDLTEAFKKSEAAVGRLTARMDLAAWYDDLDKSLAKGSKSLNINTEAGRKNAATLIAGLEASQKRWREWGEATGASTAEVQAKVDGEIAKMVKALDKQGFSKAQIKKFLGDNNLWQGAASDSVGAAKTAAAKEGAKFAGVGRDITAGLAGGIKAGSWSVVKEAVNAVKIAEAAARKESQTQSPSKKWWLLGLDLTEGLNKGIQEGSLVSDRLVRDTFTGLTVTAVSEVVKVPEKVAEAYSSKMEQLQGVVDTQNGIIRSGLEAIRSMSDGFVNQIMGGLSFKTTDAAGNALTPEQMMATLGFDINAQAKAVEAIATQIGTTLPPALLQQVLAMPSDTAVALANYLAANPEQAAQLVTNYQALAKTTETTLGIPMGEAWATVGGQSATGMIAKAKEKIAEEAADFKKWVRRNLATEIEIGVTYVERNRPSGVSGSGSGRSTVAAVQAYEALNGRAWRT